MYKKMTQRLFVLSWLIMLSLGHQQYSYAETTDLSTTPILTASGTTVKPNLMYILDDSSSMDLDYMPDLVINSVVVGGTTIQPFGESSYGYRSAQCNGLYYNPNITYSPPIDATGVSYANATYTAAWDDGFNQATSATIDLSAATTKNYYYLYTGAQTTADTKTYYNTSSTFYRECKSAIGASPGNTKFTLKTVSATSGVNSSDERTNFANWYSYYRKRIYLIKTSVGQAFRQIDDKYRVGFMTINNNTGSDLLNITDYDSTQKSAWYAKLYAALAVNPDSAKNGQTPLRSALSVAGRIYAKNLSSYNGVTITDPVQYACQQNFSLVSTDGAWNGGNCYDGNAACYNSGAGMILGSNTTGVGDQDNTEPRPKFDGNNVASIRTVVTTSGTTYNTVTQQRDTRTVTTTTTVRTIPSVDVATTDTQYTNIAYALSTTGCGEGKKKVIQTTTNYTSRSVVNTLNIVSSTTTPVTRVSTLDKVTTIPTSTTTTRTIIYRNGIVQSDNTVTSNPTNGNASYTYPNGSSFVLQSTTTGTITTAGASSPTSTSNSTPSSSASTVDYAACASPPPAVPAGSTTTLGTSTVNTTRGATAAEITLTGTSTSTTTADTGTANVSSTTTFGPTTTDTTSSSGSAITNTLADVAMYYYKTDLRTSALGNQVGALGTDVSSNIVPDTVAWQHMNTYTLGLGVPGRMIYSPTYDTDTAGDFYNVKAGTTNSASSASPCSWIAAGLQCNWPVPGADKPENIDDLWHAAVNGGGRYFSATDPSSLTTGLTGALAGISARIGASAAATASTPNLTTGDNYFFESTYKTQEWWGELIRLQLNLSSVTFGNADWSAQTQLDTKVTNTTDTRVIYTYDPTNTYNATSSKLKTFTWANLTGTERGYLQSPTINVWSHYNALSSAQQTSASGENLLKFIRGQRGNEGTLYRSRVHVLGDIVSSEAVYLKTPVFDYQDAGYATFRSAQTNRAATVFVGANDGMLHAFDATTGDERWSYIPSVVTPTLFRLADKDYANRHWFYVDGTPVVGDICTADCTDNSSTWKTILVGGLNKGGRGFYALDVTDPTTPKALWEFVSNTSAGTGYLSDADLGYSFGNPVITKLADGRWVVLLTSGYNNVSPGTGGGFLYVLSAYSGALLYKIPTGAGDTSTNGGDCANAPCPSGLAKINAWADSPSKNNTTLRVYGGDLLGNLWRFDVNDSIDPAGREALKLARFKTAAPQSPVGAIQPITTRPVLGLIGTTIPVVMVGTGKLLGATDMPDTTPQTFYGIKDELTATGWGNAHTHADIVGQTLNTSVDANGKSRRTTTTLPVDWSTNIGWYVNLPDSGERDNTDPLLALGTVSFNANVPSSSVCTAGGYSWAYDLDFRTGGTVPGSTYAGIKYNTVMLTRSVAVQLPNGLTVKVTVSNDGSDQSGSGGSCTGSSCTGANTTARPIVSILPVAADAASMRRVSWRELITE